MQNMQKLYQTRFQAVERTEKDSVWGGGICSYLENFLPHTTKSIVDVAAGYCDFINHIGFKCKNMQLISIRMLKNTQRMM